MDQINVKMPLPLPDSVLPIIPSSTACIGEIGSILESMDGVMMLSKRECMELYWQGECSRINY